jgi:hypothetical protein
MDTRGNDVGESYMRTLLCEQGPGVWCWEEGGKGWTTILPPPCAPIATPLVENKICVRCELDVQKHVQGNPPAAAAFLGVASALYRSSLYKLVLCDGAAPRAGSGALLARADRLALGPDAASRRRGECDKPRRVRSRGRGGRGGGCVLPSRRSHRPPSPWVLALLLPPLGKVPQRVLPLVRDGRSARDGHLVPRERESEAHVGKGDGAPLSDLRRVVGGQGEGGGKNGE